ncbi:MAG TPA: hypothetical protein VKA85_02355 [Candidatus Limnocylindrales bacterium]|nr:hypothetical protein [Candidatus Limnocylindrales bacterium]
MSSDPRAFLALDVGAATTSAALIGRVAGHWRLVGAVSLPSDVPEDAIADSLVERLQSTDPGLADELGLRDGAAAVARITARSAPSSRLAVVAATERSLGPLVAAADRSGWRTSPASLERGNALELTALLLDRSVSTVLAGAAEPPTGDERAGLAEIAALVSAAATRRSDLRVVLAGGLGQQMPRFAGRNGEAPHEVLLAPAANAGSPPGTALRDLLAGLRGPAGDSRRAFLAGSLSLAEALDRRVETIDIGFDGAIRIVAVPGTAGAPATASWAAVADAALVPSESDESVVDGVLGWSTTAVDRHRLRDRLHELRLSPWGDVAGHGAALRIAAARAALERLVRATPDLDALPPSDLVVVAGGAWAVAPGPAVALAVADVVRRAGACQIAWDHARLIAPLGTIEDPVERRAMFADLADDLLAPLGSVVMPQGLKAGRSTGRLVVHGRTGSTEIDLVPGGIELVDLPPGESAVAEFQFRDAVRLGTRGRHFAVDVAGGLGGLLVDLRDVPLQLPERPDRRRELLAGWQEALWAGLE